MNKVSCSVIQDILPLYIEGVVSKDTEKLVEEHLEHCEFCRCQVSKLTQNLVLPNEINVQLQEAQPLKEFKKNIKKKRNIISFLSVLITALVLIGGYSVLWVYGLPASHEGIIVKTEMQNYDEESIYPVWAIHFESRDGKALYVKTKFLYEENEEGEKIECGQKLIVQKIPFSKSEGTIFTTGYGIDGNRAPSEDFDYKVYVVFKDKTLIYSMRGEGAFTPIEK